jgi:hypothetical protein
VELNYQFSSHNKLNLLKKLKGKQIALQDKQQIVFVAFLEVL